MSIVEAINQKIVKLPVLPDEKLRSQLKEKISSKLTEKEYKILKDVVLVIHTNQRGDIKEKVNLKKVLGAFLAFGGVALFCV